MKIILVVPPGGHLAVRWDEGSMPFLGLAYVAAALQKNGFEVEILDAFIERFDFDKTVEYLTFKKPEVIGFTFTTENRFDGFRLIKMVKEALPGTATIAGGPHVSLAAEDTLSHLRELDYIVIGEGEKTFPELVNCLAGASKISEVRGLAYTKDGQVVVNPARPFVQNLDELPVPAWDLIDFKKYNFFMEVPRAGKLPAANLMTSRGCPFGCNFCSSSLMWGKIIRMHSAERVLAEIKALVVKFGVRALWFFDDTFTIDRARVKKICEMMIEEKLNLKWVAEIRVDTVDYELLKLMKEAGCFMVGFGVESGSQRIIDEVIGKKIKVAQSFKVCEWCQQLGIISNPFLILSHPGETEEDALKTKEFWERWPAGNPVSLAILHIYPGTRLEQLARQRQILPPDFSWSVPDERIFTLSMVQGNVPIFLDKLSWPFLTELLADWAASQHYPVWKKIPGVLRKIKNWDEFKKYISLGLGYLNRKSRRF